MLAQSHYLSLTSWRGLRQHLMPGCCLPSAPVVIGSSIFSCSEFPRGSYAYTCPLKAEVWRHGPKDSLPVPTWLLVVTDTGWHSLSTPGFHATWRANRHAGRRNGTEPSSLLSPHVLWLPAVAVRDRRVMLPQKPASALHAGLQPLNSTVVCCGKVEV